MNHPYFRRAVLQAYERMISAEDAPQFFINLEVDPSTIDVNIHPTKTEIKFENEREIWSILSIAVKEALGKFNVAPSLDFTTESHLDIPQRTLDTPVAAPRMQLDPHYNPFKAQNTRTVPTGWDQLYERPKNIETAVAEPLFEPSLVIDNTPLIQWDNRYILATTAAGLLLIHQHRAHTCILYKVLLEQLKNKQAATQPLLFPEVLELSADDLSTLEQLLPELQSVGFELEQFSPMAYAINAVPALLGQKNASDAILQVIHSVIAHIVPSALDFLE
jgi:DNA mismatch repair protein MutL